MYIPSLFLLCSNFGGFLLWWLECETEGYRLEGAVCFFFVVLCLFFGASLLHCGSSGFGVECVLCFFFNMFCFLVFFIVGCGDS